MPGKYATEHADALAMVRDAGASVLFSRTTEASYNPVTDAATGTAVSTISGHAIEVQATHVYQPGVAALVPSEGTTLFFVPSTYGEDDPEEGDTVVWAGETLLVQAITPIRIDGVTIAARVTCTA